MNDPTYNYDVLIVGAGNAACSAAHAALEKAKRVGDPRERRRKRDRGGNSALTGHMRFVFNGIEDIRPLVRGIVRRRAACSCSSGCRSAPKPSSGTR